MSAEHTPTPWAAREQLTEDGQSLGWIIEHAEGRIGWSSFATARHNEGESAPYPIGEANAEFIVRAANCHDDLVAALKHAEPWVESGPAGSWRDGVMAEIAAALAKAKDESDIKQESPQ